MKKYIIVLVILISVILAAQQPEPLIEEDLKVQPIVENVELGKNYWYVQTIKVYYKDTTGFKPIPLRKGAAIDSRCSDETVVTFIAQGDSISVTSLKRMSCEIVAYFNLNKYEVEWLKNKSLDKVIIFNSVTDNSYVVYIKDSKYFNRLLNVYK
jgi:hypothetical protein